ncbi:MAG: GTPase HflX [Candidatus Bathyarchaeota archaeon]|nr:GTPase HflX [Candidatus Bathyarchaeota archaeon]
MQRRLNRESSSLDELKGLAVSAGYTVTAQMEQLRRADPRYQIGKGKVEELAALVKEAKAEKVIFDNSLRPIQAYNLAKATKVEIIDRFQLILEIFNNRATTTEAKLQIQLATLKHELKHAKEKVNLFKAGEQPGFMGIGVYEADIYQEAIKRQIYTIRKKLRAVREKRVLHRERRTELGFYSISLAGYTNAGKSSLFNAIVQEDTKVDNALFTTLSTTTRLIEVSKRKILLTDTVGFIDRLPLSLIEAFNSTLEETIYSDLILLVLDLNEPLEKIENKRRVCLQTIDRIGASQVPIITVFNKIDCLSPEEVTQKVTQLQGDTINHLLISAKNQTNLDLLRKVVLRKLEGYVAASFCVPVNSEVMSLVSRVHKQAEVKSINYSNDSVEVTFEAEPEFVEKIKSRIKDLNGKFQIHTTPNQKEQ